MATTAPAQLIETIKDAFDQLEDIDIKAAFELAETLLAGTGGAAPAMTVITTHPEADDPEYVEHALACPHCKGQTTTLTAVDYSVRESQTEIDEDTFENGGVSFYYEGGHFDGITYKAGCCDGIVSLPDGWEEI